MSQLASSSRPPGRTPGTGRGGGPDRPPVRARSGRRPGPPLIFLAVLAVAAAAVWVYVLQKDSGTTSAATCAAIPSLAPSTITVQVLNASNKPGQANAVAKELAQRGFKVGAPDNDRSGRTVTGAGEIRHGARGKQAALYLGAYLPGGTDYEDTRATGTVDLVIGPAYQKLATPEQVASALSNPTC